MKKIEAEKIEGTLTSTPELRASKKAKKGLLRVSLAGFEIHNPENEDRSQNKVEINEQNTISPTKKISNDEEKLLSRKDIIRLYNQGAKNCKNMIEMSTGIEFIINEHEEVIDIYYRVSENKKDYLYKIREYLISEIEEIFYKKDKDTEDEITNIEDKVYEQGIKNTKKILYKALSDFFELNVVDVTDDIIYFENNKGINLKNEIAKKLKETKNNTEYKSEYVSEFKEIKNSSFFNSQSGQNQQEGKTIEDILSELRSMLEVENNG